MGFDSQETTVSFRKSDVQGQNSDCGGWIDLGVESETKEGGRLVTTGGHREEDGVLRRGDLDAETRIRR